MNLELQGKTALVMGGSSGIGKGIAQVLVQEGARVILCARNESKLAAAAREMGAAGFFTCDLSIPGAGALAVQTATQTLGAAVDILVTNNGGPPKGSFLELDRQAWTTGFQGLWLSAVEAIREAIPAMQKNRYGRVLLVTSSSAREPIQNLTVSNGFRAGLAGLTKSIANEVAEHGITVNGILPGYVQTERLAELGHSTDTIVKQIPAGRLGQPEELGALAAFLASPRAAYITGQSILIDGGRCRSF